MRAIEWLLPSCAALWQWLTLSESLLVGEVGMLLVLPHGLVVKVESAVPTELGAIAALTVLQGNVELAGK